jgi:hypothetical protein
VSGLFSYSVDGKLLQSITRLKHARLIGVVCLAALCPNVATCSSRADTCDVGREEPYPVGMGRGFLARFHNGLLTDLADPRVAYFPQGPCPLSPTPALRAAPIPFGRNVEGLRVLRSRRAPFGPLSGCRMRRPVLLERRRAPGFDGPALHDTNSRFRPPRARLPCTRARRSGVERKGET